jgi:hypothetical protein
MHLQLRHFHWRCRLFLPAPQQLKCARLASTRPESGAAQVLATRTRLHQTGARDGSGAAEVLDGIGVGSGAGFAEVHGGATANPDDYDSVWIARTTFLCLL